MRGKWVVMAVALCVAFGVAYYEREKVRTANDFTDALRYERMSWHGITVDYRKEPLVAWKIVSGPKKYELTGGASVLTCMDEHLLLGDAFAAPVPTNLGEAVERCKALIAQK